MTGWIRRVEPLSAARAEPTPPRAPNDGSAHIPKDGLTPDDQQAA